MRKLPIHVLVQEGPDITINNVYSYLPFYVVGLYMYVDIMLGYATWICCLVSACELYLSNTVSIIHIHEGKGHRMYLGTSVSNLTYKFMTHISFLLCLRVRSLKCVI